MESGAIASGDLADLVSSNGSTTIYPNEDSILSVLQARFRGDLNYTAIGASSLVVVNPYKTLANVNDVSAKSYVDTYKDTSIPTISDPRPLQPHVYSLASKVYLVMRRRNESQAIITRGITGSGKSSTGRLLVDQILRLSTHSKREARIADQIKALGPLLDAFGNAKTLLNPNASRHSRYLELGFNERGRIASGKVLTYGLDKSRLVRLGHEERSYHVFYQLLAGASPSERDLYNLEDPSDYALLASSGCYRLPSGPFSDDAIAMSELRSAMKTLGFKAKHITSIFSLLVAILLLGNLTFVDGDHIDVSAYVVELQVLDQAARLLGVTPEDLGQILTNRTSYVRKELYTVLLDAHQSALQRDQFVRDLYAILFAFVVETANHKIAPATSPATQVVVLDQPGHQARGPAGTGSMAITPLISAYGQNSFDEFCINFCDEIVHSYVLRHTFEDGVGYNSQLTGDGVSLPGIATMDNSACIELVRGAQLSERAHRKPGGMLGVLNKACSGYKSGKGGDTRNEDLLQELTSRFGAHASFVAPTNNSRQSFGINHYAGNVTYDSASFVERDSDLLDSAFVTLLRNSSDGFVSKLLSGPSLAAERHSKDESIIVQAQVSARPLRQPTPILSPTGELPTEEHARLDAAKTYPVSTQLNYTMSEICASLDRARLWTISCIRPNDSGSSNSFDKRRVKAQIRSLLLPDLISRKSVEYIADFDKSAFCERYVPTMQGSEEERITQCARANGWKEGVDFTAGLRSIWLGYSAWKIVEDGLRAVEKEQKNSGGDDESIAGDDATEYTGQGSSSVHPQQGYYDEDEDNQRGNLLPNGAPRNYGAGGLQTPSQPQGGASDRDEGDGGAWGSSDWDKSREGPGGNEPNKEAGDLVTNSVPTAVEELPTSGIRRFWLFMVWAFTWWCPSFLLSKLGRMKRPDVQLAWREKMTIFLLISLLNGLVVFSTVGLGKVLCPSLDHVWSTGDLLGHTAENDYWVAVQGTVYDVTDFIFSDHSDVSGMISNDAGNLEIMAGQDLTYYFPVPLTVGCEGLVSNPSMTMTIKNNTVEATTGVHTSGSQTGFASSKLSDKDWYRNRFKPKINGFRKGPLVWDAKRLKEEARDPTIQRLWGFYGTGVYDLTDYANSITVNGGADQYKFLNEGVLDIFKQQSGSDMTKALDKVYATMDSTQVSLHKFCLNNSFYRGEMDIRKGAQCLTANYVMLAFAVVLITSMVLKFFAALQLGGKRNPEMLDKFVLCQVPCYTEGEDSLRRTIDSLAALEYDDKRKLMFIICDGNIIGSGNDRTTPRIVLDILGVDPKLDPEPLLFKSVGEGSKALNYAKVYSGLYEFEGHVVPYMVIVKVGKPSERSKPGNRGKRDSQILLMHYLNRVHFDAPMSPMELEIYHQMRNVIGIDPAFYEYIFTIDADTTVSPDSLNRLVAAASDDSSIIGVCGETKLENEEGSWWTMIQVYEYYISHHLSKAFESLFGSVTCLPGCFSLYRIRTADKGRPILISNRVIDEYSEPNVDTLHKKNLFSLGEDRFLTTLLMKHFPTFKTKFIPDAQARTVAPESWRVLFSQRRRWINSTVHNLCELVVLPELFGFCCFSMRFFVFIDLLGTLILPATVVYLVYLIVIVSTGAAAVPIITLIMIGAVYGLQAVIFLLHREFMLIGWMVVYVLSYPVYSFFLPIYSFWCMDEFGWGNTRLVIGEGSSKKVVIADDDKFDDSMIPLKKFSEYEAEAWETGTRHSEEKSGYDDSKPASRFQGSRGGSGAGSRAGSPGFNQASQSGDYYRDTNLTYNNGSNPNLRLGGGSQMSHSNMSMHGGAPQMPMSQYGMPGVPFMPPMFTGSQHGGSDYGGGMQMPPMGYQNTGSMYGMMAPGAPRNTMMPMFGSGASISGQSGFAPPNAPFGGGQNRMSTLSIATTANPFAGPSTNANPTEEELFQATRQYLSQQDLMTVTKKTTREAIMAKFPQANLTSRKDFLNKSIDSILSDA